MKKEKRKKDRFRNIPPSCWPSLLPIPSLWFPMFSWIPNTFSSYCGCFPQFGSSYDGISASVCFDLIFTASVHGEPREWWRSSADSNPLLNYVDPWPWFASPTWWSYFGIVHPPGSQNDSNLYDRSHHIYQEAQLPLFFPTWWTLDLGKDTGWYWNLETSGNIFGKHAPHKGSCHLAHHC